tara:strand:+ start:2596 stop:3600 length:1005 start_codon:yes stop_codon:yes gene_type:complete
MNENKKFLIIMPAWVGDTLMAQSFIIKLRLDNPDSIIDVVVKPEILELVNLMPQVNNKYVLDIQHGKLDFIKRLRLAKKLKNNKYTTSFILQNSFKSSIIPWFADIPERVGYLTEFRNFLINKGFKYTKFERPMVERYLNLIDQKYHISIRPKLKILNDIKQNIIQKYNINIDKKNIMLCPDAEFGNAKKWPLSHWLDLANSFDTDHNIFFLGKDTSINNDIEHQKKSKNIKSLIGNTSMIEVIYLLSSADLVISNDSGLMHIAGAVDCKIIALYGSSSPFYTPPLISNDKGEVIYKNLDCSPCHERTCPLKHLNCLREISAKEVFDISLNYII